MNPEQTKEVIEIINTVTRIPRIYLWVAISTLGLIIIFLVLFFKDSLKNQKNKTEQIEKNQDKIEHKVDVNNELLTKLHEEFLIMQNTNNLILRDLEELKKKDWS